MPNYHSNSIETIRGVFSLEGDSLARAGFSSPLDVRVPGDDEQPRTKATETASRADESNRFIGETAIAYRRYLETGNEEIAYE